MVTPLGRLAWLVSGLVVIQVATIGVLVGIAEAAPMDALAVSLIAVLVALLVVDAMYGP